MNDHFFPILSLFLCCVNNNQRIFFRSRIKETLTEPLRSQTTVESLTKLLSGIIVCCSSWGTLYPLINIQEKLWNTIFIPGMYKLILKKKRQPKTGILVFLLTLKNDSLQKLAPMNFYDSTYSQNFIFKSLSQFKYTVHALHIDHTFLMWM